MKKKYIRRALQQIGIDVYEKDVQWIEYLVNQMEPIDIRITPEQLRGRELTTPWIFEMLTVDWCELLE